MRIQSILTPETIEDRYKRGSRNARIVGSGHRSLARVFSSAWVFAVVFLMGFISVLLVIPSTGAQTNPQPVPPTPPSSSSPPELTASDVESWLDGFLPYALQTSDIAGAVVLVIKDGKVLMEKGYGYADIQHKIPMDPRKSVVQVASVSKMFTWTAVMQLVEQGKLDLDRDINDYLDFKIPPAFGKPITLRNLMTHTPGFEERLKQYFSAGSAPRSLGEYLRSVPPPERIYPPGVVPAYSNYGANLAGYIVERVSGEPFPDYIDKHILKPLDMQHSTFRHELPPQLRGDMAANYSVASSGQPLPPEANNVEIDAEPAGDLRSTADDISHFMIAHLHQGRYDDSQILKPETETLMQTPAFVPVPGVPGMALGFFRIDYDGKRLLMHDGDASGFHTDMELLPDQNAGFFVSVNSDGSGGLIGASYNLRASLFHRFMDRYFPAPAAPEEPTVATAQHDAALVAREYQMSRRPSHDFMNVLYLAARIPIKANADGTIRTPALLNFESGQPQTWREVGPFVWKEVGGHGRLHMKVENGHVDSWLADEVGSSFVMEPVPYLFSSELNLPLLIICAIVLLITVLARPAAALVRRRYGRKLELEPRAARVRKWAYLAAVAGVAFLLGWVVLIGAVGTLSAFTPALDKWIRLVQLIGLLCVPGALIAVWNGWLSLRTRRDWFTRIWNVVFALAMIFLVWFSFAFSLISLHLNY